MSPTQLNNNNSSKTTLISDRDSWTGIKGLTETQNGRVCAITTSMPNHVCSHAHIHHSPPHAYHAR